MNNKTSLFKPKITLRKDMLGMDMYVFHRFTETRSVNLCKWSLDFRKYTYFVGFAGYTRIPRVNQGIQCVY